MSTSGVPASVTDAYNAAQTAYNNALASVGGNASALDPAWAQGLATAQAGLNAWTNPTPQAVNTFGQDYSNQTGTSLSDPFASSQTTGPAGSADSSGYDYSYAPQAVPKPTAGTPFPQQTQSTQPSQATTPSQPSQATMPTQASQPTQATSPGSPGSPNSLGVQNNTPSFLQPITQGEVAGPVLPQGTAQTFTPIQSNANDIQQQQQLAPSGPSAAFVPQTAGQVTNPTQVPTATYNPAMSGAAVAANQNVAAQGTVDPRSTVQGEYASLMQGFDNGQTPDWAKGAITTANEQMAARGILGSTVAANATAGAIMQAALPIAQQDAATYNQMQQANLSNEQQSGILNTQNIVNSIFSDQGAENAASQFNATSTNQMNQFFQNLASTVSQFNTSQFNNMSQFNASGNQAVSEFNAQINNLRDMFNVQNATAIDQSNVNWQRTINTANTAGVNAANNTNATNMLNISNTAMANLWQQALDEASFTFQGTQNANTIAANTAMAALLNNQNVSNAAMTQVGNFVSNLLGNFLTTPGSSGSVVGSLVKSVTGG